jgi:hypothetical protein
MKPSTLAVELPFLLKARRPVFIWGPSGAGKSSVVNQIAVAENLKVNDARMSQLDAIDLRGFPVPDMKNRSMEWLPADFLPRLGDPPGILFLDEFNGAMPAVASAGYQLILEHRIGAYVLPKHWSIVAAGNNIGDRGITHQMPAPLNNRFIHIDYEIDHEDFHKRAVIDNIDFRIRAYLRLKLNALHSFDPTVNPRAFPTPRSWYFVDEILKMNRPAPAQFELIKGTIGEGTAAEFNGFMRDILTMPDIDNIMLNPGKAALPTTLPVTHAVVTALVDRVKPQVYDRIMQYVVRLPRELQAAFNICSLEKDRRITSTKSYQEWAIANQDVLMGV